jgi:cytochrome b subunit of formate dehydrogenase
MVSLIRYNNFLFLGKKTMIKFILSVIIILALVGGAIQFVSTAESWALVINKEAVLSSVQNGAMVVYEFFKSLVVDADQIKIVDLIADK